VFTFQTAIDRLRGGKTNLLLDLTDAQAIQRLNECLSTIYESASWRGVKKEISLTCVDGIITLPEQWLRLDQRINVASEDGDCCFGWLVIKPQEYKFQSGGPGGFVNSEAGCMGIAIDQGDDDTGVRSYALTGDPDVIDIRTYTAIARRRYVWTTDVNTIIVPDCYSGLELAVKAMNASDELAIDVADALWSKAYALFDGNLGQYNEGNELGSMRIDPAVALNCMNLV
jgi:hypothetical protein